MSGRAGSEPGGTEDWRRPAARRPAARHATSPSWAAGLTSSAPVAGPAGFYLADVPDRIVAYVIDLIILAFLGLLVAEVVGGLLGGVVDSDPVSPGQGVNIAALLLVTVADLALSAVYFAYLWRARRSTLGMSLLGLRIGDERDGRSIAANQAVTRWLVLGVPTVLATYALFVSDPLGAILSLVGLVWLAALLYSAAQSPTKQGVHDRYAHTIVVRSARRPA
jgi:uncharacterized RDD family membrane protein YckC